MAAEPQVELSTGYLNGDRRHQLRLPKRSAPIARP